tara:strand:+ start:142776 stop:142943 length:168 start_codon:yes stop_codon:yes gene_type:complete
MCSQQSKLKIIGVVRQVKPRLAWLSMRLTRFSLCAVTIAEHGFIYTFDYAFFTDQ